MPRIIIFGNPPQEELRLLRSLCEPHKMDIVLQPEPAEASAAEEAIGFLSFLPCTPEIILDLFKKQSVGFGTKLPFFQRIDSQIPPAFTDDLPVYGFFTAPIGVLTARTILRTIKNHNEVNTFSNSLAAEVVQYRRQNRQLIEIAAALSSPNDLGSLLDLILTKSRDIACADAASIYVRDRSAPGGAFVDTLRFKVAQNDSIDVGKTSREFTVAIDTNSISGYVAATGRPLVLADVNHLPEGVPYKFGKDFETKFGYRMKSMLTVPLKNIGGEVVGVLQLMNKKPSRELRLASPDAAERSVLPFTLSDQDLIRSVAGLAAVSIERIQLYENIRELFEGLLDSSITAIDERDRVTSGHSRRVMGYCLAFAEAMNRVQNGMEGPEPFSADRMRQFKFAALLHDIGKIGVPEHILTKESKLEPGEYAALMARLDCVMLYEQVRASAEPGGSRFTSKEIGDDKEFVKQVNRSGFLSDEGLKRVSLLAEKYSYVLEGIEYHVFDAHALEMLSIRKGNLSPGERELINSHARSTRRLLSKIPWSRELERIPEIASHHHEKIDGSGYPDGLKGDQICLESKILAAVDIYEALVAQDRPYKPKMAPEKALEILRAEVKANHLDGAVVDFFIDQGIYKTFFSAGE